MLRILFDLSWWLSDRVWRILRTISGDDAYDRYLARAEVHPLSRREFYDQRLHHKWDRLSTCGRCFSGREPGEPGR